MSRPAKPGVYLIAIMKTTSEKLPDFKEIEKEISDFLTKRFGQNVKVEPGIPQPHEDAIDGSDKTSPPQTKIVFDLLTTKPPKELVIFHF